MGFYVTRRKQRVAALLDRDKLGKCWLGQHHATAVPSVQKRLPVSLLQESESLTGFTCYASCTQTNIEPLALVPNTSPRHRLNMRFSSCRRLTSPLCGFQTRVTLKRCKLFDLCLNLPIFGLTSCGRYMFIVLSPHVEELSD